jgi:arylformamidase
MKFVDLSVVLNEDTPVYPGDPKTKIEPAGVFEKDGYTDHFVSFGTHVGTHMDAPMHMVAGGKSLDQIPVEQFIGRGRYIKVENKEFNLEVLQEADIQEGDIVLFHTGMNEIYDQEEYFNNHPEMPEEIAKYLIEKKVKAVGVDMASPDHPPFKTHRILLSGNILIIENLTSLDKLAGKDFKVYALPTKLSLDGAPARVVAAIT